MTRKIGLDIVRAAAITLVLISHSIKRLEFVGIHGVEMFFALSGFLIGGILYRTLTKVDRWSFGAARVFLLRRWWRTLPNYYLFLVVSLFSDYCFGGLPPLDRVPFFLIFSQDILSVSSQFYGVSWSLCVEEWFYLTFPLAILFFTYCRFSKRNAFICTTILFLLIPPLLREWMFITTDPATVRMTTLPRLDAIFYGVATSFVLACFRITALQKGILVAVASIGLVLLSFLQLYCYHAGSLLPFYRAAFFALPLCFSLMLPFFASIERLPARFVFLERGITKISLWSYSMYLSHIPILLVTGIIFGAGHDRPLANIASKLIGLAICLGASRLIYEHFECRFLLLRPHERESAEWSSLGIVETKSAAKACAGDARELADHSQ